MTRLSQQVFDTQARAASSLWICLCVAALLTAACESAPPRTKPWRHAPALRPQEIRGSRVTHQPPLLKKLENSLVVHLPEDPVHLNPVENATEWGRRIVMDTVYETLIRLQPPTHLEPAQLTPNIAESFSVRGNSLIFVIDSRATFQDGRPIRAEHVRHSINLARQSGSPHRAQLAPIISLRTKGARELHVHLRWADGYVLRELAEVPIFGPQSKDDPQLASAPRLGPGVGSGPYAIEEHGPNETRLVRHENYWGELPSMVSLVFKREPDQAEALRLARKGQFDWLPSLPPAYVPGGKKADFLPANFGLLPIRSVLLRALILSLHEAPFDDKRMRHALSLMLDRDELATMQQERSVAATGLIWPGGLGDGPRRSGYAFDLSRAYALLDAAGWRDDDGDGVRKRGKERLMVTALVSDRRDPQRDRVLDQLRRAGFVVDIRVGTTGETLARLGGGEFDLAFYEWRGHVDQELSSFVGSGGAANFGGYASEECDQLLRELRTSQTPAQRALYIARLSSLLDEDMPLVPISRAAPVGIMNTRIGGVVEWGGKVTLRSLRAIE